MSGLLRYETEQKLDIEINMENVSRIMADKNKKDRFIEYCIQTVKPVIKRNKDI